MDLLDKLAVLTDAAKYDAACTSSGVRRESRPGKIGNTSSSIAGCCHSFSADGRCISLLQVLMTNCCVYDCKYCVNRRSKDPRRTAFTPKELAELTIQFYRRNYIEGLFLSSGVLRDPDYTTLRMIEALRLLRQDYGFNGYMHAKAIPGTDPALVQQLGYLADRLAKLGVEDELRNKGAKPGDEVRIGKGARAVEFDWDPTIAAGAEMLDGAQLGARGVDLRLQEQDGRSQRRTNAERRRQYHEMMDARQAVREAMMAERKAGHWADPSGDDDRHDETSLFGRGETTDSENVEQ